MSQEIEEQQTEVRRHLRRNYWLGVANGSIFTFGDALQDINLVLSVFINRLSGSNVLVGLLLPIRLGGWSLPQLLLSGHVQAAPQKMPYYRLAAIFRLSAEFGLALAVFFIQDTVLLLTLMFVLIAANTLSGGLSGLAFTEIVGKTIPSRRRGSFFAWRQFLGGILALIASLVVRYFLDESRGLSFPRNYAILFFIATIALGISFLCFGVVKEPADANPQPRASVGQQLRRAGALAKQNQDFGYFLAARAALMVAEIASPFYIIYAKETLNLPDTMAGTYLTVSTVANICSTYIWGNFSDRIGNRKLLCLVCSLACLPPLLALAVLPLFADVVGQSLIPLLFFGLIFALIGISRTGIFIGTTNFLLDIAPSHDRSIYIGLTNTVVGLASFLSALGGVLIDVVGYGALFGLTFGLYFLSTLAATRTHEPRPALEENHAE